MFFEFDLNEPSLLASLLIDTKTFEEIEVICVSFYDIAGNAKVLLITFAIRSNALSL